MKHKTNTLVTLLTVALLFSPTSVLSKDKENTTNKNSDTDNRTSLNLTEIEKHAFLSEMRQMLTSIQGIIVGISKEDREAIIKSARYSGNRMARATPESIKKKTPPSFQEIGGPTHMMFEELVIRAEDDDMETLTAFTGELMQKCLACHAAFKVQ